MVRTVNLPAVVIKCWHGAVIPVTKEITLDNMIFTVYCIHNAFISLMLTPFLYLSHPIGRMQGVEAVGIIVPQLG